MKQVTADVSCNVYVASLPPNFTDQQLFELFSRFGLITSARIMRSKGSRESKGYGFVLFKHPSDAERAIVALHGQPMGESTLQVRLADPLASNALRKISKKQASLSETMERSATPDSAPSDAGATYLPYAYGTVPCAPPAPAPHTTTTASPAPYSFLPLYLPPVSAAPAPLASYPYPLSMPMPYLQAPPVVAPTPCFIMTPDGNIVPYA